MLYFNQNHELDTENSFEYIFYENKLINKQQDDVFALASRQECETEIKRECGFVSWG